MIKKKKSVIAAAALSVVAISGIAVSSSWAGTENKSPVEPDLRIMTAQNKSATDALPALIANSENHKDLIASTARSVKSSDSVNKYWVVRNDEGKICMVALTPEDVAGTTCAKPEEFNQGGLAIQVIAQSHATEGYLFPDSVALSNNLVNVNPFDTNKSVAQSRSHNAAAAKDQRFVLDVLPTPDFVPTQLKEMAAGR